MNILPKFILNIRAVIQNLLAKYGFELKYQAMPCYIDNEAIAAVSSIVAEYTMLSRTCLISLSDQVAYCNKIDLKGCFVECGVWKGGAVATMAYISKLTGNTNRQLHLFDAFEEICAPHPVLDGVKAIKETARFGKYQEGIQKPLTGLYDEKGGPGSIAACTEVIHNKCQYPSENIHFHKGWFKDTVFEAAKSIGPIAILRLDGDWYESTKTCLEAFYDNVVPGGFIIIDDYKAYEGCQKAVDEFRISRNIKAFLVRCDTSCHFMIKI